MKSVVTPPRSMARRSNVVHRAPAATAVVESDEHHTGGGIQEEGDFAGKKRRDRGDTDKSGKRGASGTGDEDEHEDLECYFHCSAFVVGSFYCTHRAKPWSIL